MSESLFINSIYKANLKELYTILKSSSIDFHKCKDSRGMTALHIASLNGSLSVVKFLVEYSKRTFKSNEILRNWTNVPSEEGFLAVHFASFRGHVVKSIQEIMKVLIDIGTDIGYCNLQGLSLMHVAAQGDQALSLVYLKSIGLSHDVLDKKNSLPLHWASYMGCETAASILLSWKSKTNTKDDDGHTPLHLATLAGNTRIIRNLLLKGADRTIEVLAT